MTNCLHTPDPSGLGTAFGIYFAYFAGVVIIFLVIDLCGIFEKYVLKISKYYWK